LVAFLALACGFVLATLVSLIRLRDPASETMRTNVDGKQVPVVLGMSVVAGAFGGLVLMALLIGGPDPSLPIRIVGPLLAICFLVGWWDDRKGDERPRGFKGHLGALRGGAVTGGLIKLVGGGIAGLVTMAVLLESLDDLIVLVLGAAVIALAANLINLFDRAPGRASKVFLLLALPMATLSPDWRLVAAGAIGAVLATLPLDLGADAMLGDAGANPMGALVGLGFVLVSEGSVLVLVAMALVLLGLNLASEKWSFSRVIEESPGLARLDHLGRK
jgi:hypothetical protein